MSETINVDREKEQGRRKKEKKDRACPRKNNRRRRKGKSSEKSCYLEDALDDVSIMDSYGKAMSLERNAVSTLKELVDLLIPDRLLSPFFSASFDNLDIDWRKNPTTCQIPSPSSPYVNYLQNFDPIIALDTIPGSDRDLHLTPSPSPVHPHPDMSLMDLWGRGWDHLLPLEHSLSEDESCEALERQRWREWAIAAAEEERQRRIREREDEEHGERKARQAWALHAVEKERQRRTSQYFLDAIATTAWFTETISSFCAEYEIVCPYSYLGCRHICLRKELELHLRGCSYNRELKVEEIDHVDTYAYEVMCPNAVLGCTHSCPRLQLQHHLEDGCNYRADGLVEESEERAHSLEMVMQQAEEERARRVDMELRGEWQRDEQALRARQFLHTLLCAQVQRSVELLHGEVLKFSANSSSIGDSREKALKELVESVQRAVQTLWPAAQVRLFGSAASGLLAQGSDIDLVVCLRNPQAPLIHPHPYSSTIPSLQKPKASSARHLRTDFIDKVTVLPDDRYQNASSKDCGRAGAATFSMRNSIQTLAEHLSMSLPDLEVIAVVEHGRIPIIRAKVTLSDVPFSVDISVDGPSHTGLTTTSLVACLCAILPPLAPLVRVLKCVLRRRKLNCPYTGGLSSYALTIMATFVVLQGRHVGEVLPPIAKVELDKEDCTSEEAHGLGPECPTVTESCQKLAIPPTLSPYFPASPQTYQQWKVQWERPLYQTWLGWRMGQEIAAQGHFSGVSRGSIMPDIFSAGLLNRRELNQSLPQTLSMLHSMRNVSLSSSYSSEYSQEHRENLTDHVGIDVMNECDQNKRDPTKEELPSPERKDEPILGKLLLDFLQLFGQDFELGKEGLSIRGGGFRFQLQGNPTHPQASDPIVIEDPLDVMNNVGRSSYAIHDVQRCFSDALTTLKSAMARVDDCKTGGSDTSIVSKGSTVRIASVLSTGLLSLICAPPCKYE